MTSEALLRGELEIVLPEHQLGAFWLCAVYASTSRNTFKLRLLVDSLTKKFSQLPPCDAELISRGLIPEAFFDA